MENEQLADKVLSVVTKSLNNYHFDFHGARIITGQEEGAYGWITINYLLGKFTQVIISQHPREVAPRRSVPLLSQAGFGSVARMNDG